MSEEKKFIDVEEDDYQVGYGKPPKHTQFKKGQSGNPRGRKRRPAYLDWEDPVIDCLAEIIPSKRNGRTQKMPAFVWMLLLHRQKALSGDHRSFKAFVDATGGFKNLPYALRQKMRVITDEERRKIYEDMQRLFPELRATN